MLSTENTALSKRLAYLSEILIAFSNSPIPSHLLQTLADYTVGLMPYDYLALALIDPDAEGYVIHSLGGEAAEHLPYRLYALTDGILGETIRNGRMINVANLPERETATAESLEAACAKAGLTAALATPLRQGANKIGALFFAAAPPYQYSADDEQIANLLAAGLAANLEMSRLYQTLADEHSTLKSVVESAPDGVVVVNPSGFILMANPAFHAMFGLQQQDLTGAPLMTTIDHPALHQLFTQENNDTAEIKLSDGRIMQASLEAVVSRFGEHIGWAAVLHDVTLLKELAHMKDEFVNTVSHDLKNPISSILLANDMLNRLGELNPAQENLRTRIHSTANYMNELVTDLLDLGRSEAGLGLEIRQFNLAKLIDEVLFALRANAEDKEIELVCDLPDELLIQGDYKRLRQVLLNIIGNAIKYTPAKGCVTTLITADSPLQTQPLIRITVQDNGLGIPAADLPHIFDKFYRVQNEQTADIKGTGLGLAITKSIIEAHEGQIQVDSQMGEGTTFTILLPHLITE